MRFLSIPLILVASLFLAVPSVSANMDPKSATPSATATIPATPPTISDNKSPSSPILIRPTDDTITGDHQPEFVWKESLDPNGNFISYTLYLNDVASYLGVTNLGNTAGNNYVSRLEGNEIKLRPLDPIPDGTYKWYVVASDASGNRSQSTIWDLFIDTTAPILTLTDLNDYHNPIVLEGSNFDLAGPLNVSFALQSDPTISIELTITDASLLTTTLYGQTNSNGVLILNTYLLPGLYTITTTAIDQAGNTTSLPNYQLTVTQTVFTITLPTEPGESPKPIINIPYTPISIPSLPATISIVQSRVNLSIEIELSLAVLLYALLILLWKRKANLYLVDLDDKPLKVATIYHSRPSSKLPKTQILVSKKDPVLYQLQTVNHGKIYIRHLGRYSTLTVRLSDSQTYILSISRDTKSYTLKLG